MNTATFNTMLAALEHLTDQQIRCVERVLKGESPEKQVIHAIQQRMVEKPECPYCHGDQIKRHGKMGSMQRYRCKSCSKTFNATTKTPMSGLHHKGKWFDYFACMIEGKTLRESAKACGIDLKTSWRWRHRFLEAPALLKALSLQGIVEADETLFPYSEKGNKSLNRAAKKRGSKAKKPGRSKEDWVSVLTIRDRSGQTCDAVISSVGAAQLNAEFKDKIEPDSVLCSDGLRSYVRVASENKLIHKQLNISAGVRVIDTVFHIQNVNAYHSRLKTWMRRFHGVASKYLEHYLGWFRFLESNENPDKNNLFAIQQQILTT